MLYKGVMRDLGDFAGKFFNKTDVVYKGQALIKACEGLLSSGSR